MVPLLHPPSPRASPAARGPGGTCRAPRRLNPTTGRRFVLVRAQPGGAGLPAPSGPSRLCCPARPPGQRLLSPRGAVPSRRPPGSSPGPRGWLGCKAGRAGTAVTTRPAPCTRGASAGDLGPRGHAACPAGAAERGDAPARGSGLFQRGRAQLPHRGRGRTGALGPAGPSMSSPCTCVCICQ